MPKAGFRPLADLGLGLSCVGNAPLAQASPCSRPYLRRKRCSVFAHSCSESREMRCLAEDCIHLIRGVFFQNPTGFSRFYHETDDVFRWTRPVFSLGETRQLLLIF